MIKNKNDNNDNDGGHNNKIKKMLSIFYRYKL